VYVGFPQAEALDESAAAAASLYAGGEESLACVTPSMQSEHCCSVVKSVEFSVAQSCRTA
jgi:hypothetical protein